MAISLWHVCIRGMPYNETDWIDIGCAETRDLAERVASAVKNCSQGKFPGGLDVEVRAASFPLHSESTLRLEEVLDYSCYIQVCVEAMQQKEKFYNQITKMGRADLFSC